MKDDVLQRVKEIYSSKSSSESKFAKLIGANQKTLNQQLKGERAISLDTIILVLSSFEDISAEWLLRGNGEMIISDASSMKDIEPTYSQTSAMYESLLKDRDEQIEELKAEKNQLIGENNIMREQLGIRTREKSA